MLFSHLTHEAPEESQPESMYSRPWSIGAAQGLCSPLDYPGIIPFPFDLSFRCFILSNLLFDSFIVHCLFYLFIVLGFLRSEMKEALLFMILMKYPPRSSIFLSLNTVLRSWMDMASLVCGAAFPSCPSVLLAATKMLLSV